MTRIIRFVVLGIFIVFGCICFTGVSPVGSITEPTSVSAFGPAEIYAANCAKCHGADGRAKTAKGKRVGATDFTSDWNRDESRGVRIITNGKSEMPSFKKKLSAEEIRSVFNYVLRFR